MAADDKNRKFRKFNRQLLSLTVIAVEVKSSLLTRHILKRIHPYRGITCLHLKLRMNYKYYVTSILTNTFVVDTHHNL